MFSDKLYEAIRSSCHLGAGALEAALHHLTEPMDRNYLTIVSGGCE
jgi:hypothetical protein